MVLIKRLILGLGSVLVFFVALSPVAAMEMKMIIPKDPFFVVNGQHTKYYAVRSGTVSEMVLPRNIAPQPYLVLQDITFEIDTDKFPIPVDIQKQATFEWDFGDGSSAEGLRAVHAFQKIGTFTVVFHTKYGEDSTNTLSQSIQVQIIPLKAYKLPTAFILINDLPTNPAVTMQVKPDEVVRFDSSQSIAPSSRIVSYGWDFGDGTFSNQATATHTYKKGYRQATVILRTVDVNGFEAYTSVMITDKPVHAEVSQKSFSVRYLIIPILIVLITAIIYYLTHRSHKKRH